MNRSKLFLLSVLFLGISLFGCSTNGNQAQDSTFKTIDVDSLTINDTTNFNISSLKSYPIKVRGYYEFPKADLTNNKADDLAKLYKEVILERADSSNVKVAIEQFNTDIITIVKSQFSDTIEIADDSEVQKPQQINIRITQVYNNKGIACYCKDIFYTTKDDNTIISKSYFTFDILNSKQVLFDDIFQSSKIDNLKERLQNKLIEKEHVTDTNGLIDMGYFNVENMNIRNFYITNNGISFVFEPYEIACYALGEISIELSFSELAPLLTENSIISDLY